MRHRPSEGRPTNAAVVSPVTAVMAAHGIEPTVAPARDAAPERGQVGGAGGEAHVGAAANGHQQTAGSEALEEPVSSLHVLSGLRVARLDPEERPVEARLGLVPEEL